MARLTSIPNIRELSKRHFFAGMLVVLPLAVIAWILTGVFNALWKVHELLPDTIRPENLVDDSSLAMVLNILLTAALALVLAFLISLLGWASKQYLGRKVLQIVGDIIQRIPVIRSIYSALDQLLRTLTAGGGKQFSRVVYVEYPRKGLWALAFVTGPARGQSMKVGPGAHLNIYVPTTPNPTSGFHLIVPEAEVRESGLSVEEAFKTILSLGIAQSEDSRG